MEFSGVYRKFVVLKSYRLRVQVVTSLINDYWVLATVIAHRNPQKSVDSTDDVSQFGPSCLKGT